jgi:hypothetical protein
VSFQMSILKILAGQPNGRAGLDVVKQHLALFYTSGSEWTGRKKRLAERAPDLDIFGQKLIAREPGEWRITDAGRALLLAVEQPPATASEKLTLDELIEHMPASEFPPPPRRRHVVWKITSVAAASDAGSHERADRRESEPTTCIGSSTGSGA